MEKNQGRKNIGSEVGAEKALIEKVTFMPEWEGRNGRDMENPREELVRNE